ncbi:hypothetical protein [Amaricoccus sp.]|uniref:hypothetical protein n=1 Tax=Amaricoccus sp. TaxID=1872485 RepID=UPI001B5A0431|nr:hypothetical protein [Amaricoccus sp.]MBP7001961.1 hypothetical protein [Amaricoccus sp.]
MPPEQIIVIRHAQKPTRKPKRIGVREDGTGDAESLTVRGWQHAGALAAAFAGTGSGAGDTLAGRPDVIFASGAGKKRVRIGGREVTVGSRSRRPQQTVGALAEALKLVPVTTHTKGEEQALVADALGRTGVVLICWQHQRIAAIGNLIVGDDTTVPQRWPEDRYDLVYVFDRVGDDWSFRQLAHERLVVLPGG